MQRELSVKSYSINKWHYWELSLYIIAASYICCYQRVIRIDMSQTLKSGISFNIIAKFTVQTYFSAPKVPVIRLEFKQLVDVADGAGIVLQIVFNVNQNSLGPVMLVVGLDGAYQIITGLFHITDDIIIPAVIITQVRVIRIILQS